MDKISELKIWENDVQKKTEKKLAKHKFKTNTAHASIARLIKKGNDRIHLFTKAIQKNEETSICQMQILEKM